MKSRSILPLVLCVFFVGIFVGIGLGWAAWRSKIGVRDLVFQVQDYPMANLLVRGGDKVSLVAPPGGNGADLAMNFVGYSPCTSGSTAASCTIDDHASYGPYLFTCGSPNGYSCPEPGIQQSGSGPIAKVGYFQFAVRSLENLVGIPESPEPAEPAPPKMPGSHPATNAITAYVSCGATGTAAAGMTQLNDPNGQPLTTITASSGQTVYWISPKPFTLDTSKFPSGLCKNGNPGSGAVQQAQCDVALGGQNVSYAVQAQTTPSCTALTTAALNTK